MPLPDHLKAQTYWEKRTELLEESVFRIVRILNSYSLPPAASSALAEHFTEWKRLLDELGREHQAPAAPATGPSEATEMQERCAATCQALSEAAGRNPSPTLEGDSGHECAAAIRQLQSTATPPTPL